MSQATETQTLVIERVMPHPPEKVWRALTETSLLDEWLMKNDFKPVVGHKAQFQSEPNPHWDGKVSCEVLAVDPPKKLSYRWDALMLQTVVTWTLSPQDGGTALRMEQAGFATGQTWAFEGAKQGWGGMIAKLDEVLRAL